ncbi:MAG: hypothetical protein UU67_C0050G0006, partial [Candidatus Daviesbacteria bacterium GW2011_GWB1_41_5]
KLFSPCKKYYTLKNKKDSRAGKSDCYHRNKSRRFHNLFNYSTYLPPLGFLALRMPALRTTGCMRDACGRRALKSILPPPFLLLIAPLYATKTEVMLRGEQPAAVLILRNYLAAYFDFKAGVGHALHVKRHVLVAVVLVLLVEVGHHLFIDCVAMRTRLVSNKGKPDRLSPFLFGHLGEGTGDPFRLGVIYHALLIIECTETAPHPRGVLGELLILPRVLLRNHQHKPVYIFSFCHRLLPYPIPPKYPINY